MFFGLEKIEETRPKRFDSYLICVLSVVPCSIPANFSYNVSFVSEQLVAFKCGSIVVYTDGFVKSLGSIGAYGGTAAYFPKANVSIGVKVSGLLSSTLVELQAITLALKSVLDICKFDMGVSSPDFCHKCWIEKEYIHQVVSKKNLSVMWKKVKGHSSIVKNDRADFFANVAVLSESILALDVLFCFLRIENRPVSENACHFVKESGCGASIIDVDVADDVDMPKLFSVWHSDGRICFSYTNSFSATLVVLSYEISVLPLASCCEEKAGEMAGESIVESRIEHFLHEAKLFSELYMLLAKRFVLKSWTADAIQCLGSDSGGHIIVKLLSAAKLKAFYEKHNLLPQDRSVVLSVAGLLDVWAVDVVHSFGIRLGIYVSFGLCLYLAGLEFGSLYNILLTDSVSV
ncbi:hypothetical protein G9A89_018990 [Geosiphon pyriformis]|nr:hypothetical protein G9A89_018990 [Geosiphon pyriformis]